MLAHGRLKQRLRGCNVDRGILVAVVGAETAPHVEPAVGNAVRPQVFGDDARRDQFAEGDDAVVPQFGLLGTVVGLRGHLLELVEEGLDPFYPGRFAVQLVDDLGMVVAQGGDVLHREGVIPLLQPLEHLFEGVRGLAHGRYDDEQILLVTDDLQQIAHTVRVADRCTAELVDFHFFQ